jgi:hypothetical protein
VTAGAIVVIRGTKRFGALRSAAQYPARHQDSTVFLFRAAVASPSECGRGTVLLLWYYCYMAA